MEYSTERLVLRPFTDADIPAYSRYLGSNRDFLREWVPLRADDYDVEGNVRKLIASQEATAAARTGFVFALFTRGADDVVGTISVTNVVYGVFQSCNLGYELGARHEGKGYMTEALRTVIRFCFDTLSLHRIEANVMPRNKRSQRVLDRLGFQYEGSSRKYLKINGKWEDHDHYVLLNPKVE